MTRLLAVLPLTLLLAQPVLATPPPYDTRPIACTATAHLNNVPWGTRYSYLLQGVAEFDARSGRLLSPARNQIDDWTLTVVGTGDRTPTRLNLTVADAPPTFAFPPTSLNEWNALDRTPGTDTVVTLEAEGATNGLFLALRNPQTPARQPLFQVRHQLGTFEVVSETALCFVGDLATPDVRETLSFATVQRGTYSGIDEPLEEVVTRRSAWEDLWEEIHADRSSAPPLPEINFDNGSLIAVGLGDRPDGSYRVEIENAYRQGDRVVVEYVERQICGGTTMAITQPFHVIVVSPPVRSPIDFRRRVVEPDC